MKKILLILLSILVSHHIFGQYKVVNESSKRTPEWVYSIEKGYLIVTGSGAELEEVKNSLLIGIKQQISESIATRIIAETTLSRVDVDISGVTDYNQKMQTSINSKTAKLPFIGEISLSKASDFYWEERYYRKTKKTEFFCAIKYPFSEFEMKKLIMEYKEHDNQLNAKLADFQVGLNSITSIEDIDKYLINLRAFLDEFLKEDPRYTAVTSLSNQYRKLYDYISVNATQKTKGIVTASLILSDREISTRQKPRLKSNCATQISHSFQGDTLVIKYDDFGCYNEEENYIEIKFKTGNKYLSEKIYFKK